MASPFTFSPWRAFYTLGIVVFSLAGCLNSSTASRTVYEDPTILVRLDGPALPEEGAEGSTRPVAELTAADLASVLRSVMIRPEISFVNYWILRNDPQPRPAFPNSDADLLAAHLRDALANARPHETAAFFLRRTREEGIPLVTTGALARRGDQLIVVLANVRRPATMQRKLDMAREAPLRSLGDADFHVVPGPHQTVLGTKDLPNTIAMTGVPALSIDYGALLAGSSAPGSMSSPSQVHMEMPTKWVEEKLRQLRTWHEQGLITDDEYLHKRQELLKRF